ERHSICLPFLHFYFVLYPFLWGRLILDSHTILVYKPLSCFQSTHLTEEPKQDFATLESYGKNPMNRFGIN
ncbi:MAG: hypothetical protein ACTTKM_10550, partial [Prevotella fusca]